MITYYVKRNEYYKVIANVKCEVRDANNETFIRCEAGSSVSFLAPTNKISLTDDNAILKPVVDDLSIDSSGVIAHIDDTEKHVSSSDRTSWNQAVKVATNDVPALKSHKDNATIHLSESDRNHIDECKGHVEDNTIHERVLNINELFNKADALTLTQAVGFANQYLSEHNLSAKATGGLKVKYKNELGKFVSYTWDGVGDITETTSWSNAEVDSAGNSEMFVSGSDRAKWNNAAARAGFVGEIKHYAGKYAPDGYLICDGSEVSKTEYAELFDAIGDTWGVADDDTNFKLPNLIDRVIWGSTSAGGYVEAGLPNIEGEVSFEDNNSLDIYARVVNTSGAITSEPSETSKNIGRFEGSSSSTGSHYVAKLDASLSSSVYGNSSTVQPPAAKLIPIIKY